MAELGEKQMCRKLYGQIISGRTPSSFQNSEIYVKHFSDNDFSQLEAEYEILLEEAEAKGLETEKDVIEGLIKQQHWSEEEEAQISDTKASLASARRQRLDMLAKTAPETNIQGIGMFIGQLTDKLYALEKSRNELIGSTSDTYAQRKNNELIIFYSLFKDPDLKEQLFDKKEFDDLDQEELLEAILAYNKSMEFFTEVWIKKIAVMPSFLNSFFLCNDDPRIFFGKPVIGLTIYQTDLFSKGRYFKSILNESEGDGPPEEYYDRGFQEVVNWYDLQYSIIQGKRAADKAKATRGQMQQTGRARARRRG